MCLWGIIKSLVHTLKLSLQRWIKFVWIIYIVSYTCGNGIPLVKFNVRIIIKICFVRYPTPNIYSCTQQVWSSILKPILDYQCLGIKFQVDSQWNFKEKRDGESHWSLSWVMERTDSKVKHYCLSSDESLRVTNWENVTEPPQKWGVRLPGSRSGDPRWSENAANT
jgi:hypothetical protein